MGARLQTIGIHGEIRSKNAPCFSKYLLVCSCFSSFLRDWISFVSPCFPMKYPKNAPSIEHDVNIINIIHEFPHAPSSAKTTASVGIGMMDDKKLTIKRPTMP